MRLQGTMGALRDPLEIFEVGGGEGRDPTLWWAWCSKAWLDDINGGQRAPEKGSSSYLCM